MTAMTPQCANLKDQVNQLIDLLNQEPSLRSQQNTSLIETSLGKALSPRFEVVFAGAFSSGSADSLWETSIARSQKNSEGKLSVRELV